MPRLPLTLLFTLAFLAAGKSGVYAACAPFTAFSPIEQRKALYLPFGSDGPSAGDKMRGFRQVYDANGGPLGTVFWLVDVLSVDADDNATKKHVDYVGVFQDGVVFAFDENDSPSPVTDHETTTAQHPPGGSAATIIGGMDAFKNASGTLIVKNSDDGLIYDFMLSCPPPHD